ncbi:class I SAM-dependent methyltransferase [Nonomuraea sp. NPDC050556]|uniref:class I SAM-dependent methyltransferase n=1 Tax=Nonomuraea sp. NPDC050556 TaxID=3364369 RepID=UPI0037A928E5
MSEHSRTPAEDPFGGRTPTRHERESGEPWDASYHDGPAPWDIGRPQPAIVRLAAEGGITGTVLDAGCGSGDNALHVASLGLEVLGVDVAETALRRARDKAAERGIAAEFAVADALHLETLGRRFDTVLDCGLFHALDEDERAQYVTGLASVTASGGLLYVMCFSDQSHEGREPGPHPVSEQELRSAFSHGWDVSAVEPILIPNRMQPDGAPGWLATIKRT